ncbi:MAG: GNAT family N-acetyltransferase, partial [Chloroflexota bacterium]
MPIQYRPGTAADSHAAFLVFQVALLDLGRRKGFMAITGGENPTNLENLWQTRRPLYEHLARSAERFWLAEEAGQVVGYARSILRDGVLELSEFFVVPTCQTAGVGRELLARAFPADLPAKHRVVVATTDTPALARYLKSGVYARFPTYTFYRPALRLPPPPGLDALPLSGS